MAVCFCPNVHLRWFHLSKGTVIDDDGFFPVFLSLQLSGVLKGRNPTPAGNQCRTQKEDDNRALYRTGVGNNGHGCKLLWRRSLVASPCRDSLMVRVGPTWFAR